MIDTARVLAWGRECFHHKVADEKIQLWAAGFLDASMSSLGALSEYCGISNPSVVKAHTRLLEEHPELLQTHTRFFPRSTRGKLKAVGKRTNGKVGSAKQTHREAQNLQAKTKALNEALKEAGADPQDAKDFRRLLKKEYYREMLARHLNVADLSGDINNLIKLGERLEGIEGWKQEVHLEYQIQAVLPPGGISAFPSESLRLLRELQKTGIIADAEFEVIDKPSRGRLPDSTHGGEQKVKAKE